MNRNGSPSFAELLDRVMEVTWYAEPGARGFPIKRQTSLLLLDHLLRLAVSTEIDPGVAAIALDTLVNLDESLAETVSDNPERRAWMRLARTRIARVLEDPAAVETLPEVVVPPGSPIGSGDGLHRVSRP